MKLKKIGRKSIDPCEVMVIMRVDSGGAFYNAGIRTFDVILDSSHSVPAWNNRDVTKKAESIKINLQLLQFPHQ